MQQSHQNLSNGLQSFADVSPDYELAPIGIGSIKDQAEKLAEYGRNGDIYIVHAAEGETVVPMEVLDANPKVKELLFGQMRDMGLDPQEFVVGSELNSINPSTGMPEFFFKKIFRAVKKAVKGVVNVVKKAAPVVLPIALTAFGVPFLGAAMPGLFGAGSIGAGFIGGAAGSLAGGNSLKDSLKSGLISGGIAGLTGGLKGAFGYGPTGSSTTGFQGFKEGLGQTVGMGPAGYVNPTASEQLNRLASGNVGEFLAAKPYFDPTVPGATLPSTSYLQNVPGGSMENVEMLGSSDVRQISAAPDYVRSTGKDILLGSEGVAKPASQPTISLSPAEYQAGLRPDSHGVATSGGRVPLPATPATPAASSITIPTVEQPFKLAEYTPFAKETTALDILKANNINPLAATETQLKIATEIAKDASPGMFQQYGPLAAAAGLTAYGLGAFDTPPPPDDPDESQLPGYGQPVGSELYAQDPGKYKVAQLYSDEAARRLGLNYNYNPNQTRLVPVAQVAKGGIMSFPRREALVRGPGTERSDDIPAMLSDGEFVMTAKAVRGASPNPTGNKERDRQNGAKNMYAMMRNFEMRA